jgi:hypothetical protein
VLEQLGIEMRAITSAGAVRSKGRDIGVGATTLILDDQPLKLAGPLTSCAAKLSCICSRIDNRRSTIRARENAHSLSGFTCGQQFAAAGRQLIAEGVRLNTRCGWLLRCEWSLMAHRDKSQSPEFTVGIDAKWTAIRPTLPMD